MNHKSVTTFVLTLMTFVTLFVVTVSPASANCLTVNQIHDRQELADYQLNIQSCHTILEQKPFDQINSRAELAEYQAAIVSPVFFINETISVAEYHPFDQIENRAELAEYQAYIATRPIPHKAEYDLMAMK